MQAINDNSEPSGSYDVKEYNDLGFAQVEFKYDANGNLISDLDRKIATIRYNLLNLPDTIQFENGNQIVNTYNASGRKLKTRYFTVLEPVIVERGSMMQLTYQPDSIDESGTVYDGQFEHSYNMGGPIWGGQRRVRIVHNPEGYTTRTETTQNTWHVYNYYRRDHLGNNCAVWDATNDTTLQKTVYYASGLPLSVSSGQSTQPYKYNGKEFIEMHGYDTYDYGFRGYYAAVGRFTTVDPLAEKEYGISPYVYCGGNPVNRIDPTGMKWANKETRQEVDKLRANIISATSQTKKLIKEGRIDPKDGEARLADLKHALLELKAMKNDKSTTFKVELHYIGDDGETKPGDDPKTIVVSYPVNAKSVQAHEFKHGYQILVGELDLELKLYDKGDEIGAIKRELAISGSDEDMQYEGETGGYDIKINEMDQINTQLLDKIYENGKPVYKGLPTKQIP